MLFGVPIDFLKWLFKQHKLRHNYCTYFSITEYLSGHNATLNCIQIVQSTQINVGKFNVYNL